MKSGGEGDDASLEEAGGEPRLRLASHVRATSMNSALTYQYPCVRKVAHYRYLC